MREVTIKGVRQGILLVVPDDQEWESVREALKEKLAAAATLITGAKAQLDVGDRPISADQLTALLAELKDGHQLELSAVVGTHDETKAAAEAVGLTLTVPAESAEPAEPNGPTQPDAAEAPAPVVRPMPIPSDPSTFYNNALYMRQTIRSGQSVRHDGTIIICGDVNAGAEVIATGDIIVFGTLRGVAHAGATGDEGAQIIAINLRPTQIRIAGYIARSPDAAAPPLSKFPEVARVQNAEIHIIPLRDMNTI